MGSLIIFAPYLVFCAGQLVVGITPALMAGAAVAGAAAAWDRHGACRTVKSVHIASAAVFATFALVVFHFGQDWSVSSALAATDVALLLTTLFSIALEKPFGADCARDLLPREQWCRPETIEMNYVVTTVWSMAFAAIAAADLATPYITIFPVVIALAIKFLAIGLAAHWQQSQLTTKEVGSFNRKAGHAL